MQWIFEALLELLSSIVAELIWTPLFTSPTRSSAFSCRFGGKTHGRFLGRRSGPNRARRSWASNCFADDRLQMSYAQIIPRAPVVAAASHPPFKIEIDAALRDGRLSQLHKLCAAQIVAIRGFSFGNKPVARVEPALTSTWPVNMLRPARKGLAARPGFFDQAAPKS